MAQGLLYVVFSEQTAKAALWARHLCDISRVRGITPMICRRIIILLSKSGDTSQSKKGKSLCLVALAANAVNFNRLAHRHMCSAAAAFNQQKKPVPHTSRKVHENTVPILGDRNTGSAFEQYQMVMM